MSKFLKIVIPMIVILAFGAWFLFRSQPSSGMQGWDRAVQRSSNPLGMVRVYDVESETTLFWHHSDPDALPVRIEKQDATHWIVVFEKAPK